MKLWVSRSVRKRNEQIEGSGRRCPVWVPGLGWHGGVAACESCSCYRESCVSMVPSVDSLTPALQDVHEGTGSQLLCSTRRACHDVLWMTGDMPSVSCALNMDTELIPVWCSVSLFLLMFRRLVFSLIDLMTQWSGRPQS